jgi:hypothetical protein
MTRRGYHLGVVVSLLALTLGACTSSSSGPPSSKTTASATVGPSLSTEPGSAPATEGTGPETPQSPGSGGSGELSLPNLPTGGGATNATCVDVSWLGTPPIPDGYVVKVTSVQISGPFTRANLTSDCSSAQACDDFLFRPNGDSCGVGFTYTGDRPIDPSGDPQTYTVQLAGQLSCPAGDSSACDAAAGAIKSAGGTQVTIEVDVASSSPSAPDSSPATGSPPGSTSPADGTSTQPAAGSS